MDKLLPNLGAFRQSVFCAHLRQQQYSKQFFCIMINDIWVCGYSPKHGYFRNKSHEPFATEELALQELKKRREDEYWRGVRTVILVEIWLDSENRGSFRKIWECTMKQVDSPIRKKNEIGNFTYGY